MKTRLIFSSLMLLVTFIFSNAYGIDDWQKNLIISSAASRLHSSLLDLAREDQAGFCRTAGRAEEKLSGALYGGENDPRVTRLGSELTSALNDFCKYLAFYEGPSWSEMERRIQLIYTELDALSSAR